MTTDCPGVCNAAYRRAISEGSPDPGSPWPGEPVWCRRDAARIHGRIGDLQTLAALYEHGGDGYGEAPGDLGHRGGDGQAPSPSPRFDTLDEIERMLREWETSYCEVKGWPTPPRHGRYATVSMEITTWLYRHFDGIMASPFAREFGDEVLAAARELVLRAKAGSGRKRGAVPCPRCEYKMLFSTDGGRVFWCAACGRPVRQDEYGELCRAATPRAAVS